VRHLPRGRSHDLWRDQSLEVQTSAVVAGRAPGPKPPRLWATRLRKLIAVAGEQPQEGPPWWTPMNAYFGSVETRTDPDAYEWDGMKRLGRRDAPLAFFQFTLAGWGHFQVHGHAPQRLPPGSSFFAVVPSRHRYYLPKDSPGWTFGWIGIYHPYLVRRITKQVAHTGPVLHTPAASPLIKGALRLVRGAFRKDFQDRFAVELALFEFVLAYERLAQEVRHPAAAREHLLDALRNRVLDSGGRPVSVDILASERGMSRSHFSHYFRERTGLTPARFMTEVRIQEAARLLVATRLPLARIADQCGFANANHFGKVFRRFRHQSPAVYRQTLA
jgi:AraC-like DNA-binding protein